MSAAIELALKKQRLQLRSAALRAEIAGHAAGIAPWLAAADKVRDGAVWLRRHPAVVVGTAFALLAARPRVVVRWVRRSLVAWQAWRRVRAWLVARGAL